MRWSGPAFLTPILLLSTRPSDAKEQATNPPASTAKAAADATQSETPPDAASDAPTTGAVTPPASGASEPAAPSSPLSPGPAAKPPAQGPEPAAPAGPPLYYVEQQSPAPRAASAYAGERPYEPPPPPLYYYEPPPPPRLPPKMPPRTALWLGIREAWFVPFGSVWLNSADYGDGVYFRHRSFADYASTGAASEVNVGVRLSRRYNLFGLWEHAALPPGGLDDHTFGGQRWGASNLYGAGLRFSSDPSSVGFLTEIALGYREFHTSWADGTSLSLTGAFDARIGLGADIRLTRRFALSPMLVLGGGSFEGLHFSGPSAAALFDPAAVRQPGEYGTLKLEVGFHADIF